MKRLAVYLCHLGIHESNYSNLIKKAFTQHPNGNSATISHQNQYSILDLIHISNQFTDLPTEEVTVTENKEINPPQLSTLLKSVVSFTDLMVHSINNRSIRLSNKCI